MIVIMFCEISASNYLGINNLYAWLASCRVKVLQEIWKMCTFICFLRIAHQSLENDDYEHDFLKQLPV